MARRGTIPKVHRIAYRIVAVTAVAALTACAELATDPGQTGMREAGTRANAVSQVFTSGSDVKTWDPIIPAAAYVNWGTTVCTSTPLVGRNANWQNPHNAYVLGGHPWAFNYFFAPWINARNTLASIGPDGHNWTMYSTQVTGNGTFVIRLLADNCSWIYLDGTLVGVQGTNLAANSYGLTLNGTHTLEFIIFDGGGLAGGKFILETTSNPPPPLNNDLDGDSHPNNQDAFPLDPTEWADSDGDGVGDNADAYPNDPTRWMVVDTDGDGVNDDVDNCPALANAGQADQDGDGVGDVCDPDLDGDGVDNGQDAYPTDPAEWADSDGDGVGDNGDAFGNSNTGPTIVIGACDSGVENRHLGGGTWSNDLLAAAKASSANHGAFVSAVSALTNEWKKAGLITGRQQGAIVSCAARTK
jgi:hypothetical protein